MTLPEDFLVSTTQVLPELTLSKEGAARLVHLGHTARRSDAHALEAAMVRGLR